MGKTNVRKGVMDEVPPDTVKSLFQVYFNGKPPSLALLNPHRMDNLLGNDDIVYNTPALNKTRLKWANERGYDLPETVGEDLGENLVANRT